ncbi:MAG: thiamine biosynthesis protein ApbE [Bacteroidetes bacterium GWD2_45_23]|nr:MAG: thiamine biosynthesis protein ApbE [Bacteroidetes bacterium GWC2_46_850]OFX75073.1 MAG: thiamine biosynthesis protein ApbE [Bacteroidetes bacterium GWC1_47_7]OFX85252.1 MAG: thiamine biosynthesis protein ApbE [Bacteroidetes bacterium GWD2_45_23]HAR38779.1 thiamine biosynthesis protein ApbE [Porphyromonadaceae bacterium]HBB00876.1 thiamine biosynthesis protein ApbE [Porphyromonadaceae bacterium]
MRTNNVHASFLTFLITLLVSCGPSKKEYTYHQDQGEIFTTGYHIKYAFSRSLKEEIVAEFDRFNLSLNPFMDNSIISKINRNEPVKPDSLFIKVFRKSMEVSRRSGGKFDITASPLINAWGFGFQNMDSITPEIIDSLKMFVGFDKISMNEDGEIIKTDPRVTLNTSAIAKGYACDVIADLLERHGIENYMVEIGGEITASGVNDKGECWRIGVDKPIDDPLGMQHELQVILSLCNKAMATSGNYRNYYVKDGKKYAHTIDPHTGYPSQQDILGATVIADDCMTADAYATAFMAMGMQRSKEVSKELPGLYYYFIYEKPDSTLGIEYSDNFEQFFTH